MKMRNILIHYNEIALKGRNRPFFEKKLQNNIKAALLDAPPNKVIRTNGRISVVVADENLAVSLEKIGRVFGISSYSVATEVKTDLKEMKKGALQAAKLAPGPFDNTQGTERSRTCKTFKIETRRAWKQFSLNSMEISAEVGAHVLKNIPGLLVRVKNPDITINLEVLKDKTFIYFEKFKGLGGLPVGSSGQVLSLISGGIDSPIASYLMMKRGCEVDFIHFHSYPQTDKASIEKVEELIKILSGYQNKSRLYLAPIIDFQKEVVKNSDSKYRIILYRRLMYKVAEAIALKFNYKAVVSGDNLGQVASQTLENMGVIGYGIGLPILRPLLCFDKEEIIAMAKKIATFEISIERHEDCCSVFLPKNPATKTRISDIIREEEKPKMNVWVEQVLRSIKVPENF